MEQPRTAIVLFNLGGPDSQEAVKPFLRNLFSDPAIIRVPGPFRWFLAWLISTRRAPVARAIYQELGGGSPILPNTEAQARALEAALVDLGPVKAFIAMRYWHPRAEAAQRAVLAWKPDRVVLLPLYPQFSTTTTGSSLAEWDQFAASSSLKALPTRRILDYPAEAGFIEELAARTVPHLAAARASGRPVRILLSAHGLPKKIVDAGDPYQKQVEETAAALRARLQLTVDEAIVCYQSRVGPLEWIGPSTESEVRRAGADRVALVLVPVAFVSEHSETLVELDSELRHVAEQTGVASYHRVPTVDAGPAFIEGLARLVRTSLGESV